MDIYDRIGKKLDSILYNNDNDYSSNIRILVNNVGMGYSVPEYFINSEDSEDYNDDFIQKMININIVAITRMTSLVLKRMIKNNKNSESDSDHNGSPYNPSRIVINISSGMGCTEFPMVCLYSSCKYFQYLTILNIS